MKVNLAGLLRQAADAIDPERDNGAYAFMLGEVADHVQMVRDCTGTLDQFADLYMIYPIPPVAKASQAPSRHE